MSSESQRVVKVRLEIEIPQGGPADIDICRFVEGGRMRILDAIFQIDQPPSGTPTVKARNDSGNWLICTCGSFPSGNPPRNVLAKVYNKGDTLDQSPPDGTAAQSVASDRTWGKAAPFELPVPNPAGTSTFVAWGDYGDHYTRMDPPLDFNTNTTSGITECQAASSGSGGGVRFITLAPFGMSIPATLYAHISNASTQSGVYALLHDPQTMAWTSDTVCGSHGFRLRCQATGWQLNVKGTAYQPSVAQCGPSPPFQIVFHNVDLRTPGCGTANAIVEILLTPG